MGIDNDVDHGGSIQNGLRRIDAKPLVDGYL